MDAEGDDLIPPFPICVIPRKRRKTSVLEVLHLRIPTLKGSSKYREGYKFTTSMFHLELEVHVGHSNFFNHTSVSETERGIFSWSRDRPLPIPEYCKMPLFHKCHTNV